MLILVSYQEVLNAFPIKLIEEKGSERLTNLLMSQSKSMIEIQVPLASKYCSFSSLDESNRLGSGSTRREDLTTNMSCSVSFVR